MISDPVMLLRCPTCGKMFDPAGAKSLPFCSSRCRQIDLGRWLDERIGIPVRRQYEDEEEPSDQAEGWGQDEEDE